MLNKFFRIYNTLKYLKPIQVFFQIWYRLKAPFIPHFSYNKYFGRSIYPLHFNLPELFLSQHKAFPKNKFKFLNLEKDFGENVDWNFMGHGKLWNYNLQYFDFLHDELLDDEIKIKWIEDFCLQLTAKKVKPEPYPVSLRIINWILYASKSGYSSPQFIQSLQYQIRYLQCNLEYHILANHYLENLVTLCVASFWLKDTKLEQWSFQKLKGELNKQFFEDGGHYENSPMYHSIITVRVLILCHVISQNNIKSNCNGLLQDKIALMAGWLNAFSFSNDTYAHFGDSTNNIAPLKKVILKAIEKCKIQPKTTILQKSGYRKLSNNLVEVLVDVGNISPKYQPGHAHSDMLHFCLQFNGCPILVDTGISTYNNNTVRAFERATIAHNTVSVHRESQSDVWSAFRVGKRAAITLHLEEENKLSASHDGYASHNISHFRTFALMEQCLLVEDELKGNEEELAEARFHFDYEIAKPELEKNILSIEKHIKFEFEGSENISVEEYQQALEFNHTRKAYFVNVKFKSQLRTKILFS